MSSVVVVNDNALFVYQSNHFICEILQSDERDAINTYKNSSFSRLSQLIRNHICYIEFKQPWPWRRLPIFAAAALILEIGKIEKVF